MSAVNTKLTNHNLPEKLKGTMKLVPPEFVVPEPLELTPSEPPQFITGDHVIEVQLPEGLRLVKPKPSEWVQPQKEL